MSNSSSNTKQISADRLVQVYMLARGAADATAFLAANLENLQRFNSQLNAPKQSQAKRVASYLAKKFLEGMFIGLVLMLSCLIDRSGLFVRFAEEYFTQMQPIAVVFGLIGGYYYALHPTKTGWLASVSKSWLDLIQQFFTLGVGAYWFIKFGLFLRGITHIGTTYIPWSFAPGDFIGLALGAILVGGFWELRDEQIHPVMLLATRIATISALVICLIMMTSVDGGKSFLPDVLKALNVVISHSVSVFQK